MGAKVFANGMEVSGKASDNKSIAAMPDVCMSPPSPPAGPVPVPYPNSAMASDTAKGTKTVKIGGKEAGMKNSSTYSKSNGDEPATQSFGANVGSHKIQGEMKHSAWSSDVKLEGANAIRMGDMTTHNNGPAPGVSAITVDMAAVSPPGPPDDCATMKSKNDADRSKMTDSSDPSISGLPAGKPANAMARASVSGAGGSMASASRFKVLNPFMGGGLKKGLDAKGKYPATSSNVCPGAPYTFPKAVPPAHLHAEPRLLESVPLGGPKPTVTLAIDWRQKGKTRRDPCKHCRKIIAHACACMDIQICDEANKPQPQCPPKE